MPEDDLKGLRVAVYARYSTEMQSSSSIEDQHRVCRRDVERRGGVVGETLVFSDAAVSAIRALREQGLGVRALQDYYAGITTEKV